MSSNTLTGTPMILSCSNWGTRKTVPSKNARRAHEYSIGGSWMVVISLCCLHWSFEDTTSRSQPHICSTACRQTLTSLRHIGRLDCKVRIRNACRRKVSNTTITNNSTQILTDIWQVSIRGALQHGEFLVLNYVRELK